MKNIGQNVRRKRVQQEDLLMMSGGRVRQSD